MAKETLIGLLCEATGEVTDFEVAHAERILNMKDSGWLLPEDSAFMRNEDGTITRRGKKAGNGEK
jgi:hypothetical protein